MNDLLIIGPRDSTTDVLVAQLQAESETASCRQVEAPLCAGGGGDGAGAAAGAEGAAGAGATASAGGATGAVGGGGASAGGAAPAQGAGGADGVDGSAVRAGGGYAELLAQRPVGAAPGGRLVVVHRPPHRHLHAAVPDPADAAALFAACAAHPPAHLVLIASAAALEPNHQNPGLVMEPPHPPRVRNPIARAWLELEAAAHALQARVPAMALTVLRPAAVAASDGGDYLCRVLRTGWAMPLAGHDPSVQLLAPEDLARAVALAVHAGSQAGAETGQPTAATPAAGETAGAAPGPVHTYHVAPAGVVPLRAALRLAGRPRLPAGRLLQRAVRALPARLGWADPIEQVDYLRYSVTVGNRPIEEDLGFVPRQTSAAAVAALRRGAVPSLPTPSAPATSPAPETQSPANLEISEFDDFGMSRPYIAAFGRTLFHFLHRHYWRIEVDGLDRVPREGRGMLVGVHRGFMPWDGVMLLHTVVRGVGRYPRFLIHPGLVKFPFLADYMTKLGGIIACQENADHVLGGGQLLGMFPEGIQGAFTLYRDAYRLGKFGRDEYVKMALRHRAPIIPFVTVGSAEIYPILGKIEWRWFRRLTEWPFLPITPTFPLVPLPLPSKWHTRFLEPMALDRRYGPDAAQDAEAVRAISQEVRGRMQEALDELRRRRKSIFFGSIFEPPTAPAPQRPGGGAAP